MIQHDRRDVPLFRKCRLDQGGHTDSESLTISWGGGDVVIPTASIIGQANRIWRILTVGRRRLIASRPSSNDRVTPPVFA